MEAQPKRCEMMASIQGQRMYLWRAVDSEGEILDILVQLKRNKAAARKLMRKLLKKQGFPPSVLVTDKLPSYGAARRELGLSAHHEHGLRKNNRAENSHQVVRRREKDAGLQVTEISSALPVGASCDLQHLQPPAPSHFTPYPALL
jgi:transposase-like protein